MNHLMKFINYIKESKYLDDPHDNITINDYLNFKKLISDKYKINITKQIGKGSYGIAFLTDNKKVFKITTDDWEYETAKKIGDGNKQLVNYYNFFKLSGDNKIIYAEDIIDFDDFEMDGNPEKLNLYGILMDYVDEVEDEVIKKIIIKMSIPLKFNINWGEYLHDSNFISKKRLNFYNIPTTDENLNKLKWTLTQFNGIFNELEENNIEQVDIGLGNIGIKNDSLVLYDISGRF